MRIVKEAEERRNEILDVAEKLFIEKGFDAASTNDILAVIGIARGTLYYHFKSKEEILDAIIERIVDRTVGKAKDIASDKSIPTLKRLTMALMALNLDDGNSRFVIDEIHKPQNALMHQKSQEMIALKINPIITGIVKDGIKEGLFNTDYPEEAVEMAMLYSGITFDGLNEMETEERIKKITGFVYNTERLLGAKKGLLMKPIMQLFGDNNV
ncbi:MAG: TetR/AcrR family transcriptional regulator [Lachnospiraceae bacterium]|nr:TetR/AcrR family transcriptional regulator [Lachnospiraceae bacterium]